MLQRGLPCSRPPAGQWLVNTLNFGSVVIRASHPAGKEYLVTWDGLTPLDLFLISLGYAAVFFAIVYYLPRYKVGHPQQPEGYD